MPPLGATKGDSLEIHHTHTLATELLNQVRALYTSTCRTHLAKEQGGGGICGGATTGIGAGILLFFLVVVFIAIMGFCFSSPRSRRDFGYVYPTSGGGETVPRSPSQQYLPTYSGPAYTCQVQQTPGSSFPSVVSPATSYGQYYTARQQPPPEVHFGQVQVRKY